MKSSLTYSDLLIEVQTITAGMDRHFFIMLFVTALSVTLILLSIGILLRLNSVISQQRDAFGSLRGKLDKQNIIMEQDARIIGDIKDIIGRNTDAINRLLAYLERSKR